ncbi:MAG: tRNA (N(6)-L-threonylcarbamoyladenosine(37)-C(2))-methylthiotransferase MtaB [Clostridia bacterium]|nr:tRNA (N(6)-L-threonylcarbamoyladenosine(37)-C(2))-methylthiotransferase MtaB [Clostridia bacterium]
MSDNKLPKISVFTLGCKVNQYDGDAMLAIFNEAGFEVAEGLEFADIYILNTCAVTAEAEKKSRQAVSRIIKVNPSAKIYVCGCASQNNFVQFAKSGVVYISGTDKKTELARQIVAKYVNSSDMPQCVAEEKRFDISDTYEDNDGVYNLRTRHFIKVQDGCDNYCNYCIIPYLRGHSRSRSVESIIKELDGVRGSVKEIVVTGINLSAYGLDIGLSLAELLKKLAKYDDLRVRLGSLEVCVVNDAFLKATKKLKHFCPHFHLSLQSGDDSVLMAMNRHYDTEQYFQAVKLIRGYYPSASITTDIIVGYPTETEEMFENCMKFARKVGFSDIHVFSYSSRKGTVAGRMPVLPAEVVDDRQRRLSALKRELADNYLNKQIGMPQQVLFETQCDGLWVGHTPNYVKVYSANGRHNEVRTIIPRRKYCDGLSD